MHLPSHRYVEIMQECRIISVASNPYDWLFKILAMRAQGLSLRKTDGEIDEW